MGSPGRKAKFGWRKVDGVTMSGMEALVRDALIEAGWRVFRRGWPDFLAIRDTATGREIVCVEVKLPGLTTTSHQSACHEALVAAGLPVYVMRDPKEVSEIGTAASLARMTAELRQTLERSYDRAGLELEKLVARQSRANNEADKQLQDACNFCKGQLEEMRAILHKLGLA